MPHKTVKVTIHPREVELPHDLAQALHSDKQRMKKWQSLSYTNRRGMDVLLSAVTLIVFIRREGSRRKLRLLWLPIGASCLIGVSCGLPLFLYLRERQLASQSVQ